VIWSAPLLIIIALGALTWISTHTLDPYRPLQQIDAEHRIPAGTQPLTVEVVALDWKWLFIYPEEGVASVNEIVAPAGRPLHFSITSASVMNMFFVPQLGSMIAAMNGMVTQLHLQADHPGDYYGESAQYSGDGFSGMHFVLHAVPPDAFTRWIATARASGPTLDRAAYAQLARQSQDVTPFTYRSIDPDLFDAVSAREIAPGPGPTAGGAPAEARPKGDE